MCSLKNAQFNRTLAHVVGKIGNRNLHFNCYSQTFECLRMCLCLLPQITLSMIVGKKYNYLHFIEEKVEPN